MRHAINYFRSSHRLIYVSVFAVSFICSSFSFRMWDLAPDIVFAFIISSSVAGLIVFILGSEKRKSQSLNNGDKVINS